MEGSKPFESFEEFVSEEVDTDWFKKIEMDMKGVQNRIERLKEFSGHVEQEIEAKYGRNRVKFEGAIHKGKPVGKLGVTSDDFDIPDNADGIQKVIEKSADATSANVDVIEAKPQGSATVEFILELPKNIGPIVKVMG